MAPWQSEGGGSPEPFGGLPPKPYRTKVAIKATTLTITDTILQIAAVTNSRWIQPPGSVVFGPGKIREATDEV